MSLTTFLCVAHGTAAAVLLPLDLALLVKLVLLAAIAASLGHSVTKHGLLKARSAIVAIEASNAERATALTHGGEWRDVEILGTTYVSPWLTVLNLRNPDKLLARHVVLVPDNVDPEEFRQLRVVLRWARASPTS